MKFSTGPALPPIAELLPLPAELAEVTPAAEQLALGEALRATLTALDRLRQAQKAGLRGARLRAFVRGSVEEPLNRALEALGGIGGP